MSNNLVEIERLTKVYPNGKVTALSDINLKVDKGEFLSILGPSGSGKTTLLNIIGALDTPTSGKVAVDGLDLSKVTNLNGFRARKVGFVFQLYNLIPSLNAFENVQLPMFAIGANAKQRKQRAMELLETMDLKDRMQHTPNMLSGGERQRVAIARALANHPSLILGDEPTGTLGIEQKEGMMELFCKLNTEQGITLILVTHDLTVANKAQRIINLVDGHINEARV
jgi:putative ABC transport system ATP-binding protein